MKGKRNIDKFISVPRNDNPFESTIKAPYWILTDIDDKDVWYRPLVLCKCGELTSIGNHTIRKDGRVTASYHHTHGKKPCGWHVHIKLANWIGVEFPSKVLTQPKK